MKKTTIRLALFSAGLLILCISVIFNPSCIALIGENITGLVYGLGIVLLTVGIFFPGTNSLALLDKQVPEHSELKAAVAGILISLGLVSLFSFIVSLLGIIYFKDVVPSEHFFAVCSALSLATANNFCLGLLLTWFWNRRIMNEDYYAKIPFTGYYYLIGDARNHKEI
jgi:hypothetical protein